MRSVLSKRHSEADMDLPAEKRRFVWVARLLKPDGRKGRGITLSKMPRPNERDRNGRRVLSTMSRAEAEEVMALKLQGMEADAEEQAEASSEAIHLMEYGKFVEEYERQIRGTVQPTTLAC